jgi:drug/metabolite transporter (DMT)-like permease
MKSDLHWKDWLIFLGLCVVWGTSFILIKKGLIAFNHYDVAVLRIVITFISFLPFLFIFWAKIPWNKFWQFLLVGITGSGIPSFLYPIAQTQISSSTAGILNSLTPIFTLIAGFLIFKIPFTRMKFFGVMIGFIGACLLVLSGDQSGLSGINWYALYIVGATICYGISVNAVKAFFQDVHSLLISAVSFSIIGPFAFGYLLFSDIPETTMHAEHGLTSFIYIALLAILSTVIGTIFFFRLVQRTNPVFSSSISYLVPVVAIFWGLLDGEFIGIYHLLSMALILVGIYLVRGRE